jgi:site-specific DNA recombinase
MGALSTQLKKVERQVEGLLERVLDATVPSVIAAYEERIRRLEADKVLIRERMLTAGKPRNSFERTLRTSLEFLSNLWNLWHSGDLVQQRTVLKLAFVERLQYKRNEGLRTANLTLPFKALASFSDCEEEMVHPARFELTTSAFGGQRSIQLSYGCRPESGAGPGGTGAN